MTFKETSQMLQTQQSTGQPSNSTKDATGASGKPTTKVMITGDDILIEYVSRLVNTLGSLEEDLVQPV